MKTTQYLKLMFGIGAKGGVEKLRNRISDLYGNKNVYILENGRAAIHLFLKSLNLPKTTKVAIQAFTCNAVVNPILWNNLEPLYIDIHEDNFSMCLEDLKKKYDENVKVLILQHTFGLEADRRVVDFCKEKGIILLEDCAHTLGNAKLGNWGDATMLSFGVEKILSTRVGGALMINNGAYVSSFEKEFKKLKKMGFVSSFVWMLNPVLWRVMRKLSVRSRKFLSKTLRFFGLLSSGFSGVEDRGKKPSLYPRALSAQLATVVLDCLVTIKDNLQHRDEISAVYFSVLSQKHLGSLVRYPYIVLSVEKANEIIEKIANLGFPLYEKWYYPVVYPRSTNLEKMKYIQGSCPKAEYLSERIVNLPTSMAVDKNVAREIAKVVLESE